ncbi:alpha-ketoacid dehydrogenase subunit alpha/beta [Leeuwenhoekiella palythoae]|uniref:2-oxoisovalerate dehydrogenase E1 component n=1 Tax=Leeuwenhoekiella palythoae TaxID=573501 RepID=A0A1M5ZKI7_9FLAO|nr:dehydrogenase E1 component subunit alpha/beta [Leeuwenhoekiella palythoae]RXG27820.1 pyruvate/2-oxoglutarate/acetoin dehydrogenase E1 component [Leeuwenhoekiella palythoae]SHI24679.1 2-oxoisovalerate dehydrogenase E1 component [Leeuwenhoekiella palythoae]
MNIEENLQRALQSYDLNSETLLKLYEHVLRPRRIEEKMLILLRQGKISKWFSGIGQEAIAVGLTLALHSDEYILPMHRNLGVFTSREIPLDRLFSQWQGKSNGFTKGRDRSFHFGTQDYKIVGMISHLGPQLGVADGIALAHKLSNEAKVTAVFTGEGGTSEGDFHEALNVASVWDLPVLFCIENNGYGLSTPTSEQYRCEHLADRAKGYGMESHIIDGNNILEVYTKLSTIAQSVRERSRPVLIEFKTFRMRGHEEASGVKYVPETLLGTWALRDPVTNFESYLIEKGLLTEALKHEIEDKIHQEIEQALQKVATEPAVSADLHTELNDVFAPVEFTQIKPGEATQQVRFIDAIQVGLRQSLERFANLVLMGQDVAAYGGVFKITEGFVEQFGSERIRNTPICESAIVETAMGLAINGYKAIVEMQFADFVSSGFNPIVNYLAKSYYRWGQPADVVIRMPCGAGVGAGPFHSQTNEAWFTHTAGLKVVYPAFPYDAKGLLAAAIEDQNPVLFFEHKALYRTITQEIPEDYYTLPLGKASVVQEGSKITLITYGAPVHWVIEVLNDHKDWSVELIDLRSLIPLDYNTIKASVAKTGKVLLVTEDVNFGSITADISAYIAEECFTYLDAPIKRLSSLDTPVPFAQLLENQYLAKRKLAEAIKALLAY